MNRLDIKASLPCALDMTQILIVTAVILSQILIVIAVILSQILIVIAVILSQILIEAVIRLGFWNEAWRSAEANSNFPTPNPNCLLE